MLPKNNGRVSGDLYNFLDAATHLYKRPCPSVCRLVRWSVRRSVCNPFFFFKENDLKWPEIIRKFSAKHKSGQNQSTPPIKTSMCVKVSNNNRIVVPFRDLFSPCSSRSVIVLAFDFCSVLF